MTEVADRLFTVEEFAELGDMAPGCKVELVAGRLVVMSPVGPEHGEEALEIGSRLRAFAKPRKLGRVRVEAGYRLPLGNATLRGPDVSFVSAERAKSETLIAGFVDGIPDLAVEVVSPGDRDREIARKVQEYAQCGVPRVWVVRPELATVTVHRPDGTSQTLSLEATLTSDDAGFSVPGFELPIREIFDA
jgi:Uma2 family endonuclease